MFKQLKYFLFGTLLFLSGSAYATNIGIHVDLAYNGDLASTTGFKVYRRNTAGEVTLVADITDNTTRTYEGITAIDTGRNYFYITAYNATEESEASNEVVYEYLEAATSGLQKPTIVIKFN